MNAGAIGHSAAFIITGGGSTSTIINMGNQLRPSRGRIFGRAWSSPNLQLQKRNKKSTSLLSIHHHITCQTDGPLKETKIYFIFFIFSNLGRMDWWMVERWEEDSSIFGISYEMCVPCSPFFTSPRLNERATFFLGTRPTSSLLQVDIHTRPEGFWNRFNTLCV